MKDRKYVKDMDEKEFLERYASKKAIDDAEKRSQEKLRDKKIAELNEDIKNAEHYLEKNNPKLYHQALIELDHVKKVIDSCHGKYTTLKQEDLNYYNTKIKSIVNDLIAKVEYQLSKANAPEQKAYKEVIEEAKGYLKKEEETTKPILEKIEKVFTPIQEKFKKDVEYVKHTLQKEIESIKKHKETYKK